MSSAAAMAVMDKEKRRRSSTISDGFAAHLLEEKKLLEHKLTTSFPDSEDILFDKDMELLMMDGYGPEFFQMLSLF